MSRMKCVIMCAGASTRTEPLTLTRPKSLLKIANKTILEHALEQLAGLVDEIILIVGYKKEMIIEKFGNKYKNLKLTYVEQKKQLGTGHALLQAKTLLKGKFLVMGGDDLFFKEDIKNFLKHELSLLAQKVKNPENFGIVIAENNLCRKVIEKPKENVGNLANTGCYVLDDKIFALLEKCKPSSRGEIELIDALNELAKTAKITVVKSESWMPIGYPWDLLDANAKLLSLLKADIKGEVEKNATLNGVVVVGKNTVIKNGVYIEGPAVIGENCTIGPNCYIRASTSIGNNCKVGNAVEIKNSILMDFTHVGHLSYVGDSVLGEKVNFGAGTITANLRHDDKPVKSNIKGALIETGRRKLGTIVGDNVHTGIHTSIYPGRKLWPNTSTRPGEILDKDRDYPVD